MLTPDTPLQSANDPGTTEPGSRLLFIVGAVIVAASLGIAAAHAPGRIRLLGLFSLGFGILAGWIISQFALWMRYRIGLPEILVIGIVTCAALIGSTWQSFRLEPSTIPDANTNPIAAALINQMRKEGGPILENQPIPAVDVEEHPADRFREYLARRVQMLGAWTSPWPEIFWGCEVLAGTFGAIWIGWVHRRQEVGR